MIIFGWDSKPTYCNWRHHPAYYTTVMGVISCYIPTLGAFFAHSYYRRSNLDPLVSHSYSHHKMILLGSPRVFLWFSDFPRVFLRVFPIFHRWITRLPRFLPGPPRCISPPRRLSSVSCAARSASCAVFSASSALESTNWALTSSKVVLGRW